MEESYVVAVRRDKRDVVGEDWVNEISSKGATVVGSSESRAQITASQDVADRIRDELGDHIVIEPIVEHQTQDEPSEGLA